MRVAVVGGGVSGLSCATNLRRLAPCAEVTVFTADGFAPNAPILGGRLMSQSPVAATGNLGYGRKRISRFDVACQGFTAVDPAFSVEVAAWVQAGVAKVWHPRIACHGQVSSHPLYHGHEGMESILQHLRDGLQVIHALVREIRTEEGLHTVMAHYVCKAPDGFGGFPMFPHKALPRDYRSEERFGPYDYVVIAPGTMTDTSRHVIVSPEGCMREWLSKIQFAPVWIYSFAFEHHGDSQWDMLIDDSGPLRMALDQSRKWDVIHNDLDVWTLLSAPGWSKSSDCDRASAIQDFDGPLKGIRSTRQRDDAARVLRSHFEAAFGKPVPDPVWQCCFMWRNSFPASMPVTRERALLDGDARQILVGDWMGGCCEAAWLSGAEGAAKLLSHVHGGPCRNPELAWQSFKSSGIHFPGLLEAVAAGETPEDYADAGQASIAHRGRWGGKRREECINKESFAPSSAATHVESENGRAAVNLVGSSTESTAFACEGLSTEMKTVSSVKESGNSANRMPRRRWVAEFEESSAANNYLDNEMTNHIMDGLE